MLEQEILEVEKKLLLHSKWLHKYLTDVNRVDDCLYIPLAGILRVLLCDSKFPILLKYSQELGIPLQIIGTPSIINEIPDNPPIAEFNFLGVGWDSAKRGYTMPVEEFLDTATGIIPIKLPNGSVKGSSYTPRQIIKWVSNKEGISHLDFDKPSAYETLKEVTFHSRNSEIEGILIQRLIYQIAKWAFIAINYVLEYSGIFEVIDNELNNLVSFEPIDLETLPIISHYKLFEQGITYFEGEHYYHAGLMVELSLGFSWNGIIKIIDQLYTNQRIIYQAKTDADSKNEVIFTISIYKKEFFCSVKIKDDDIFILSAGNINETGINNRYIFLSCEMTIQNGTAKISIWINNQKIGTVEQEVPDIVYTPLTKQVIGGSVEGKDSAAFFLRELILVNKCLNDDEKIKLSKYFWMQFIKEEYLDYI